MKTINICDHSLKLDDIIYPFLHYINGSSGALASTLVFVNPCLCRQQVLHLWSSNVKPERHLTL